MLLFSFSFAVFGNAQKEGGGSAKGKGFGYKFYVISHGSKGDPVWAVAKQAADDASATFGVDVTVLFSEQDNTKQVDMLNQALVTSPNGIALTVVDPVAFDQPVLKAVAKGVPVITFNQNGSPILKDKVPFIGADLTMDGYVMGKAMQKYFKKGDHVVIPEEVPGAYYAVVRAAGIKKAMDEIGVTTEELDAGYELAETSNRIAAYIKGHPETKGILCVGGLTTDAAVLVAEQLKLKDKVVIGGSDLLENTTRGLKSGYVKATMDQQLYMQVYCAIGQLVLMNFGKFTPADMNTGKGLVTAENVNEVLPLVEKRIR
jgi:simple sugar transport system substrate-binding protein